MLVNVDDFDVVAYVGPTPLGAVISMSVPVKLVIA